MALFEFVDINHAGCLGRLAFNYGVGMRLSIFCVSVLLSAVFYVSVARAETLEQAWADAYRINPSLEAERAKLRAIDEGVSQAQSHWRPSIDATANVGRAYEYIPSQGAVGNAKYANGTYGYGVQLTQPLFRGFRTDSEIESADNKVLAGRARLQAAEQQLFIDTATAFLDVIRDQAVLEVNRDNEKVLEEKLEETKARSQAGDLTQTDVRQAESRLARAHVSRYQAESTLSQDRASYVRLVGKEPGELKAPELTLDRPKDVSEVLHLAETHNPAVIAAQFDVDSAAADIDLSKGSLLPEINLVGGTNHALGQNSSFPGRRDSSQVLIQATMPLYRAGADYSRSREAQQTASQRRMELSEAQHKSHELAQNAWQALQTAQAAVAADKDGVEAAALALKGVREESKVGTRTTIDVLNAEQEVLDANVSLAKSEHDRNLAILQIRSAIGELVAGSMALATTTYDPKRHYDDVHHQWFGFSDDDARYAVKASPVSAKAE